MRRVATQKPGFFAKSGEDAKNIRETRFLGLSASGFMHFHQRNRVLPSFSTAPRSGGGSNPRLIAKVVGRRLKNLSVLFQRTSAMRRGIDSPADSGKAHNFRSPLNSQNHLCSVLPRNLDKLSPKKLENFA
jgi:hypothetical protein